MKKLIFQYYVGSKTLPKWANESVQRFKHYAKLHGADYWFTPSSSFSPECHYFEHLRLMYDENFSKYDQILYVDVDVIVERFEDNIFDCQIADIGMVPEYRAPGMNAPPVFALDSYFVTYRDLAKRFDLPVVQPHSVESKYLMFNSGVILWSRSGLDKARSKFLDWKKWHHQVPGQFGLDQPYMNGQVTKHLDYTELPLKWNCFPAFRFDPGHEPKDAVFVHYTGGKKKYIEQIYRSFNGEN